MASSTKIKSIDLEGHSGPVRSVVFSPSGHFLASASDDNTIRLWNAKLGTQAFVLIGHINSVRSVAFSSDSAMLASGSDDKTIKLWNVATRREITTLTGHNQLVTSVAFSPDGTFLASVSEDETVRLWEVKSKTCTTALKGHFKWVHCVAFSPNSRTVASGSSDKEVRLWRVGTGACLATLIGHKAPVRSVTFSPDGKQLASSSDDKTIILWDATRKVSVTTFNGHTNRVNSVSFSPNGNHLASGSDDGTIHLWDIASRSRHSILTQSLGLVECVTFSPDGSHLASATYDNMVRLWSIANISTAPKESILLSSDQDAAPANEYETLSASTCVNLSNDITSRISLAGSIRIGFGGFGGVYSGSHMDRGKVALKKPHKMFDDATARRFLREIELWCSVSHRYVLPCLGMCQFESDIYVVSPFIDNGDLHSCMSNGIPFNPNKILYEVAEALAHLHHIGIIHGDVKAQNVLLSRDGSALLCDFGLAKMLDTMVTSTGSKGTGSVRWMAPEMFRNASRSMATDVYSLGITIAEVLSGQVPYPDITESVAVVVHVLIDGGRPPKVPLANPEGKSYSILWETAEKCWAKVPEDRPNMGQVLGMLFSLARERN